MSMDRNGVWDWFTIDKDLQDGALLECIEKRLPHRLIPASEKPLEVGKGEMVEELAEKGWYNRFQSGNTQPTYDEGFIDGHANALQDHVKLSEVEKLLNGLVIENDDSGIDYQTGFNDALTEVIHKLKNLKK